MNDPLTQKTLMNLVHAESPRTISIYMRTHRMGNEAEQDPIRLRNLLDHAEEQLQEAGLDPQETGQRLAAARRLQDDHAFWQQQSDGLALFLAPEKDHIFRLPVQFDELAVIGPRFHLKPLLPLFTNNGRFYLLALSQNNVRLFRASRHSMDEMALDNIPTSLEAALWHDDEEPQLQYHTGTGAQAGGKQAPLFHGQGIGSDDEKEDIRRFLRQVDRGVVDLLAEERAPMVIAGVDYVAAIYRELSHYPNLLSDSVSGNPDNEPEEELHAAAWAIAAPVFRADMETAQERYHSLAAQDLASAELSTVVQAAHAGRIDTVFTALDRHQWGTFDVASNAVALDAQSTPHNEDLLNMLARVTLAHGGTVYALDHDQMPDDQEAAAIFRW